MPPDILALPLNEGTLFIGPRDRFAPVSGARLREILTRHAEDPRLRNGASAWGLQASGTLQRPERSLAEQVACAVEAGRLVARFSPLFRDHPCGPRESGPRSVYQLGSGPDKIAPASASPPRPSSPSPPPRMSARTAPVHESDFPNEPDQIATLKKAAEDGTPLCEICESLKAARAAAGA